MHMIFFFSTDIAPRDAVQVQRAVVGIIVSNNLKNLIHDVKQASGRCISVILKSKGRNLCLAPATLHTLDTT